FPGLLAERGGPSVRRGRGDLQGCREVTPAGCCFERGRTAAGWASLWVTRVVLRALEGPFVRSPREEAALPRWGRASHGRPRLSRSRGRSAGRSSRGPAGCGGAPGSSSC